MKIALRRAKKRGAVSGQAWFSASVGRVGGLAAEDRRLALIQALAIGMVIRGRIEYISPIGMRLVERSS